jgi:hemolysin III
MMLLDLREPINAWSHGAGMMLAFPLIWIFWRRCVEEASGKGVVQAAEPDRRNIYERGKIITLMVFGLSLAFCYGNSAVYHALWLGPQSLNRLRRLDHVGIYVLIAGTYTPVAWSLMRRSWREGTLATVWSLAGFCAARVWFGGVLPVWESTLIYLTLGWGALFCYRELARDFSHWMLLWLPLGGAFYSVGALINLMNWPIFKPGDFGAHELFHFFVIAGSACHIQFMLHIVVPARQLRDWQDSDQDALPWRLILTMWFLPSPPPPLGNRLIQRPHFTLRTRVRTDGEARLLPPGSWWEDAPAELRPSDGAGAAEPAVILNPAEP